MGSPPWTQAGRAPGTAPGGQGGLQAILHEHPGLAGAPCSIAISSPAFAPGSPLPARYWAAGGGLSPPLSWRGVPPGAAALALVVEGADSPVSAPLVHALVTGLAPVDGALAAGALDDGHGRAAVPGVGLNSLLRRGWLPPDAPPAQGPQRVAFQVFALAQAPRLGPVPTRSALRDAILGHVLARGLLLACVSRD